MDAIDKKIIRLLQENAKLNTKELASRVGLSTSPTFERIKKLENAGVIAAYHAEIDPALLGQKLTAFIQISLQRHSQELINSFKEKAKSYPEVQLCAHVSGNYDFLLKVLLSDMNAYHQFVVNKLSTFEGIANIQSSFVLESVVDTHFVNV